MAKISLHRYGERLIGMNYSKTYRYKWYPKGSTDCSGFAYFMALCWGHPLIGNKVSSMTSCYEVYADGYDLVYPESYAKIGKTKAPKGFYSTLKSDDIVFFNLKTTTRANKITHIGVVDNGMYYIHTSNNREKACLKPINAYDGNIVAVIRLKKGEPEMIRPIIKPDKKGKVSVGKLYVRRLQALLNVNGAELTCDGVWGKQTRNALINYRTSVGLSAEPVCDSDIWDYLTNAKNPKGEFVLTRELKKGCKGEDVRHFQNIILWKGYDIGSMGADGDFGSRTELAVKLIQKAYKLTATGVIDKSTSVKCFGVRWSNK